MNTLWFLLDLNEVEILTCVIWYSEYTKVLEDFVAKGKYDVKGLYDSYVKS